MKCWRNSQMENLDDNLMTYNDLQWLMSHRDSKLAKISSHHHSGWIIGNLPKFAMGIFHKESRRKVNENPWDRVWGDESWFFWLMEFHMSSNTWVISYLKLSWSNIAYEPTLSFMRPFLKPWILSSIETSILEYFSCLEDQISSSLEPVLLVSRLKFLGKYYLY